MELVDMRDLSSVTTAKDLTLFGSYKEKSQAMESQFDKVIEVKQKSHRSWNNLYAAANKALGLEYSFGTEKVEKTSETYLNIAARESGLTIAEIRAEIERRKLLR